MNGKTYTDGKEVFTEQELWDGYICGMNDKESFEQYIASYGIKEVTK